MIPDWLPQEAWEAFIDMRKQMGKKHVATEYAKKLLIKKLETMKKEGQDIEAVINESIMRGWTGLFPLKDAKLKNWWETPEGIQAKGMELGLQARSGETEYQFKDRINKVIASGGIERRAESRTYQADLVSEAQDRTNREVARSHLSDALKLSRIRH